MDINALKQKLVQLNSKGSGGSNYLWKPEEGTSVIRIVPLKSNPDNPFQELMFHYGLGGKTYLSPLSYGEADPIAEASEALVAEGGLSKEEYKAAKKLYPQTRTYVPIVVRGKESEGVKFWSFGKTIYSQLLTIIADEDYGDISDVKTGRDIKVKFTPKEKSSTDYAETEIVIGGTQKPLTEDKELLEKLLNDQPVLLDQFKKHTYEELKAVLDKYADNSGVSAGKSVNAAMSKNNDEDEWATPKAAPKAEKAVSSDVAKEFEDIFNS